MAATYTQIDSHTLLCSHQPHCILLHTDSLLIIPFPGLPSNVYLVFPVRSVVTAKKTSVNRHQIGLTPGFAFTEYKVQGATFESAVLDLRRKSKKKGKESHKRFCSTYVQLSRLRTLQGVFLLEKINLDDIDNKPYPALQAEDDRLQALGQQTLNAFQRAACHHVKNECPNVRLDIDIRSNGC